MPASLNLTLNRIGQVGAYVALYVMLDWFSLIQPFVALGISPWNPPAGLGLALFLHHGLRLVPHCRDLARADPGDDSLGKHFGS